MKLSRYCGKGLDASVMLGHGRIVGMDQRAELLEIAGESNAGFLTRRKGDMHARPSDD